ncbi:MAG: PhoH family protein [Flavobacteriales bacterium]|nr:PhoH family protein [Flavobacteriales bacterium]
MNEIIIEIEGANPVDIYGAHNVNLELIRSLYPTLKLIARGNILKVLGEEDLLIDFERKFNDIIEYVSHNNHLPEDQLERIIFADDLDRKKSSINNDVLVYGVGGKLIKALTENQKKLVESSNKNDKVFAIGPAGTGKTYTSVALAVRALKNKEVRRIILTRPAVEAGENLGFLPGDMKEKLDPYMQPLYDALRDMIPHEKLEMLIERNVIQIAPLAFMRGRTLDGAFVILDEAQNTTHSQMKMFLTRMGKSAKFLITGDPSQVDLPQRGQKSGLKEAIVALQGVKGIGFIYLDDKDVVRHRLVKKIINAYKNLEDNG